MIKITTPSGLQVTCSFCPETRYTNAVWEITWPVGRWDQAAFLQFTFGAERGKPMLARIVKELEELEVLKARIKERAMIYQCEAKEEKARVAGLPLDTYYNLPYAEWVKISSK
jgi:hypothetical protein